MAIVKEVLVTYDENFISWRKKRKKNRTCFFFERLRQCWNQPVETEEKKYLPLCIPACKKKKFVPPWCVWLLYFAAG